MTLRNDLEVAFGGAQLRVLERAIQAAAGLRVGTAGDLSYYHRPGGGQKLPLVAIHGFGGDKETWLMMSALVARGRGLALVDLPGHGRSRDVDEVQASTRGHAEAVMRVMDLAGLDRAVLCGNSMGGGVALRLAASWPDRVAGLVLVASVGRDIHDGGAREWAEAGQNPLIPRMEDIDKFMALVLERPPPVSKAVIRHVITQRARKADLLAKLFRGFMLAGGDEGVPKALDGIHKPALVIHGEQDRIIDRRVAEDLVHALPRAELVVMRGVGHAPQLEAPRATARLVEAFARRIEHLERA